MFTNFCALLLLWPQLAAYGYTMPQQYSADVVQKRAEAAVLAANGGYGSVPVPNDVGKSKPESKPGQSYAVVDQSMQQKPKVPITYAEMPNYAGVKESKPVVQMPTSYGVEPQKPLAPAPNTESAAVVVEKPASPPMPATHGYGAVPKAQPVVADKVEEVVAAAAEFKTVLPTSYAAYGAAKAVHDAKPQLPQSYASYAGQAASVVSIKESAQGPSPPPSAPVVSYGEAPKVDKPVINELPPPPPPANYGSIPSVAVVDMNPTVTVPPTTVTPPTTKKVVAPGTYGQEPVREKPAVVAQMPTGYGEMPQVNSESKGVSGTSAGAQIPASYGGTPNDDWRKDQVVDAVNEQSKASFQQKQEEETKSVVTDKVVASTLAPEGSTPLSSVAVDTPAPESPVADARVNVENENNEIQEQEQVVVTTTMAPAPPKSCTDKSEFCDYWKGKDECEKNPAYMRVNCAMSCGTC